MFVHQTTQSGKGKIMRCLKIILAGLGAGWLLAGPAGAQTTNAPATLIENFEQQTNAVIVKGFSLVGAVSVGDATISVRSKESTDPGKNQKVYGIMVVYSGSGNQPGNFALKNALVVDYDELDSLIGGMDYLAKIGYDVTPLSGFDASYATKSGLRFSAHSERRQGGILMFIRFGDSPKIQLTTEQFNQLHNLIAQAKTALDSIK